MDYLFYTVSSYSSNVATVALAIFYLYRFSSRPIYIRTLGLYALISLFFSFLQFLAYGYAKAAINPIGHIFVLLEAMFLSSLFYTVYSRPKDKRWTLSMSFLFILFYAYAFAFLTDVMSSIRTARDLLLIFQSFYYFRYLIKNLPKEKLSQMPMLWIASSILLFFSGTFFMSLTIDYLVNTFHSNLTILWGFRNFFRVIFYAFLCYAAWLEFKSQGQPAS